MIFFISLAVIWLIAIIALLFFLKGATGCSGNCYQGRRICDCKKREEHYGN